MMRPLLFAATVCCLCSSCNSDEKPAVDAGPAVSPEQKIMDSIAAQVSKARDFQNKGRYDAAMTIADAMLQKFPGQLDAMDIKADVLKTQGKEAEAMAVLEKAYALQPRDKETAYNLAYEYADAKNAKALALTDTLIKYDKTETVARAWYIKAHYQNKLGNPGEAIKYYDSSLAADYNFSDAYLDKGQVQYKQKKFAAALKTFGLGQKFSPAAAEFYFWTAKTEEAMGNLAGAKENYASAYALDKKLTQAKEAAERLK